MRTKLLETLKIFCVIVILVVAISFISGANSKTAEINTKKVNIQEKDLDVLKYEQIKRLDHDIKELKEDISRVQRTMKK